MASTVDATGNPNPEVGGVDAGAKIWRFSIAKSWIRIRKNAPKGREVNRCVLCLLKDLHQSCTKEMDAYMLDACTTSLQHMCRKEQKEFEEACPC